MYVCNVYRFESHLYHREFQRITNTDAFIISNTRNSRILTDGVFVGGGVGGGGGTGKAQIRQVEILSSGETWQTNSDPIKVPKDGICDSSRFSD